MTAPPGERKCRTPKDPAPATTPIAETHTSATDDDFDFDTRVVAQVDWSIWQGIRRGDFRLAIPCEVCGRYLTDPRSKRAHRGPRCAAKRVVA